MTWARAWSRCRRCDTTEVRHWSRGLCRKCYFRERLPIIRAYNARRRAEQPERVKELQRRSQAKNRDYYRAYGTEWQRLFRSKWPVGGTVEVELGAGAFSGVIVGVHRGRVWSLDVRGVAGIHERIPVTQCRLIARPSALEISEGPGGMEAARGLPLP